MQVMILLMLGWAALQSLGDGSGVGFTVFGGGFAALLWLILKMEGAI